MYLLKNLILFVALFIGVDVSKAEIIETSDSDVIYREALKLTKDDIVIFDIKGVLFTSKDQILTHQFKPKFNEFLQQIKLEKGEEEAKRLEAIVLQNYEVVLIDENIPQIIKAIQNKDIKVIALTGGYSGSLSFIKNIENLRIKTLKEFNIDFSSSFPITEMKFDLIVNDFTKPVPLYKNGVIFTSKYPKAYVLENFLQQLNFNPKKIIFIDNDIEHIEDVRKYAAKAGIDYIGVHYTKANEQQDEQMLDMSLAMKKFEILVAKNLWISDEVAKCMISNDFTIEKCKFPLYVVPVITP